MANLKSFIPYAQVFKQPSNEPVQSQEEIIRPSVSLIEWEAPERIFKTKPREFYRKIAVIILFFAALLLVIKEFLIIAVLGIIFFVVYVFNTVPAKNVKHKITTNGIDYASLHLYRWKELRSFYVEKKDGHQLLIVDTIQSLPGRLLLIILNNTVDIKKLTETMNQFISINENPQVGILDKLMSALSSKIKL